MTAEPPFDLAAQLRLQPDLLPVRARRAKVRGWRRRMRELDAWAAKTPADPTPYLENGLSWLAIRFDRWRAHDHFPLRFRRRAVEQLVRIHDMWLPRIRALDEPAYLGLSLKLPHIYDSRVLAGTGELGPVWREWRRPDGVRCVSAPPPSLYHRKPCDLSRFEWTHAVQVSTERLSAWEPSDWPRLAELTAHSERLADGDMQLTLVRHVYYGCLPEMTGDDDASRPPARRLSLVR